MATPLHIIQTAMTMAAATALLTDPDWAAYSHSITILLILVRSPHSFRLFFLVVQRMLSLGPQRMLAMLSGRWPPPTAVERLLC